MLAESGETLAHELAKYNRAKSVCVCLAVFCVFCILHLHKTAFGKSIFVCVAMMIKCVCLWFCGINGLFTKTVNKRE